MLTVEIQINGNCIDRIHAVNISPEGLDEGEVHSYCVYSQSDAPNWKDLKEDPNHLIHHRRTEGAQRLAVKMLEKLRGKK